MLIQDPLRTSIVDLAAAAAVDTVGAASKPVELIAGPGDYMLVANGEGRLEVGAGTPTSMSTPFPQGATPVRLLETVRLASFQMSAVRVWLIPLVEGRGHP